MRPLLILLAAVLLTACGVLGPDQWEERREALERGRARWSRLELTSYRYTLSQSCECIPAFYGTVDVVVEDGTVATIVPHRQGVTVPPEEWSAFSTVDELFDRVEGAIQDRAEQFRVQYDRAAGYPTLISLDIRRVMVDDEVVIRASDLSPLE